MKVPMPFLIGGKGFAMRNGRIGADAVAMAAGRMLSMGTGILTAMLLSRMLPLAAYGTYSTGNMISATATSISAMGLIDAVNYYYNGAADGLARRRTVNTVFLLIALCGVAAAAVILLGRDIITGYFRNPMLASVCAYAAFRPLLANAELASRNLHLSHGRGRFIALRNAAFSTCKLLAVALAAWLTGSVRCIFACLLALEFIAAAVNFLLLEKSGVRIRPHRCDAGKIREILSFSLPMGAYIQANALMQHVDALVIGRFESVDRLAIYANCAARLPIDFVSSALLAVLIPAITRSIRRRDRTVSQRLLKAYLRIGCIFSWTMGLACIILSEHAVQLLYGREYLPGTAVFALYRLADMLQFANLSLVLSASGRTKALMRIACAALAANLPLNVLCYRAFGFVGPAMATALVTAVSSVWMLHSSARALDATIASLFDGRYMVRLLIQLVICGAGAFALQRVLVHCGWPSLPILMLCGGLMLTAMLCMNRGALKEAFRALAGRTEAEG